MAEFFGWVLAIVFVLGALDLIEFAIKISAWANVAAQPSATCKETDMDFGDAVRSLKAGHKVAREGWNGKGMYLWLLNPYAPHPDTLGGKCNAAYTNPYFKAADNNPDAVGTMAPWIGMKTADNKFVPWLASQTDVLAEDWTSVQAPAES